MVINGDIFTDYPFANLAIAAEADAHLVLVPNPPQHPRGDFGLEYGRGAAGRRGADSRSPASRVYRAALFAGFVDGVRR